MRYESAYLQHHGVKGMKWGVRRFQTKSGGLTPAGRKRYNGDGPVKTALKKRYGLKDDAWERDEVEGRHNPKHMAKEAKANKAKRESELRKEYGKLEDQMTYGKNADTKKNAALQKRMDEIDNELNQKSERKGLSDKQKKALKVGAAVAGTSLAAYGAYKFHDYIRSENGKLAVEAGRKAMDGSGADNMFKLASSFRQVGDYKEADRLIKRGTSVATNAMNKAYDDVNNVNFAKAVGNVYRDKRRR